MSLLAACPDNSGYSSVRIERVELSQQRTEKARINVQILPPFGRGIRTVSLDRTLGPTLILSELGWGIVLGARHRRLSFFGRHESQCLHDLIRAAHFSVTL
jgi:hypothetical protein